MEEWVHNRNNRLRVSLYIFRLCNLSVKNYYRCGCVLNALTILVVNYTIVNAYWNNIAGPIYAIFFAFTLMGISLTSESYILGHYHVT